MATFLERLGTLKPSWSGILAGAFVALGTMITLHLLGMAIAFTALPEKPQGSVMWLAVWSLVVPILSLAIGGLVAGRLSGAVTRLGGALHGAASWGFSLVVGLIVLTMVLGIGVRSVTGVGGAVANTAGAVASGVGEAINPSQIAQTLGLSAQDLLAPINRSRAQQGKPPLTVDQLQAALQDAANTALRQGRLDQDVLVGALVRNTAIDRQTAQQLAQDISNRLAAVGPALNQALNTMFNAMAIWTWFAFGSALISLVTAMAAAAGAVSRAQRRVVEEARERLPPFAGPPQEVHT